MIDVKNADTRRLVGVMPAAGRASRLPNAAGSKEVLPLHPGSDALVTHTLLHGFAQAGCEIAYVVLRDGKWDIPAKLGDGADFGLNLAYLTTRGTPSAVHTVDCVYAFSRDCAVLFGFPDILFRPADSFARLTRRADAGADLVLGLFPCDRPESADMVEIDAGERVRQIVIKQAERGLRYAWVMAWWSPAFTAYLHEYLISSHVTRPRHTELQLGEVMQAAIDDGLRVDAETFPDGRFLDTGTPETLAMAATFFSS